MSQGSDAWYIRLPDGRVLRAANTAVVRTHVHTGHIPADSRVCRAAGEEWMLLEWTEEFADLVNPPGNHNNVAQRAAEHARAAATAVSAPGVGSRLDPERLQTIGVRGLVDELLAALDSTLLRKKILLGCVSGVATGVIVAFAGMLSQPVAWLVAGIGVLIVHALCNTFLTQLTFVELSRLRPAQWRDATPTAFVVALRLFTTYLVAVAVPLIAIRLLRVAPSWVAGTSALRWLGTPGATSPDLIIVIALMLEVIIWPTLSFAFLLAPVMVVEECSFPQALAQWWRLLKEQVGRIFLYEALAVTLGSIATLPFCIPLGLVIVGRLAHGGFDPGTNFGLYVISGLALAPMIAYVAVANLFIYLNLRYEQPERRP
jgi:hypothetical protein